MHKIKVHLTDTKSWITFVVGLGFLETSRCFHSCYRCHCWWPCLRSELHFLLLLCLIWKEKKPPVLFTYLRQESRTTRDRRVSQLQPAPFMPLSLIFPFCSSHISNLYAILLFLCILAKPFKSFLRQGRV